MEKHIFSAWCQKATGMIRYGPDRAAVSKELRQHLEDRYDELLAQGLSEEEAAEKTLAAMGSAEEIAPQLAAVHTPWLGYIHRLVRVLAVTFAVFSIFVGVIQFGGFTHQLFGARNHDSIPRIHGPLDYYCHPDVSAWSDGYRFQVNEAGYSRSERKLYFDLEIIYWPWMEFNKAVYYIWAVDSFGNYYDSMAEEKYNDPTRVTGGVGPGNRMITLYQMEIMGFDCDAQWVELHYDRDGRDLVLRIDLTGGARHE